MISKRLFIHAPNIHQGGGLTLLLTVLSSISKNLIVMLTLDERLQVPVDLINKKIIFKKVKPNIFSRLLAEKWLQQNVKSDDIVLCFGNLPPLFNLKCHTFVFIQNRYLVDNISLNGFTLRVRLRIIIEKLWLYFTRCNVNEFIVQTKTMKKLLELYIRRPIPTTVLPFVADRNNQIFSSEDGSHGSTFDFLYVASGEPHKNHRKLIEAWILMADDNIYPTLRLTIDDENFEDLCFWIAHKVTIFNIKVTNVGAVMHSQIEKLYTQTGALIYPSKFESFGLPLIEARQTGLPILASELDYVRDLLDPVETFDPNSAISISRAVKRHLGVNEKPFPIQNSVKFVAYILK